MGLRHKVYNCIVFNCALIFVLAVLASYHLVLLPDVDAVIKNVPPSYQSKFSIFPPKTQIHRQFGVIDACANYNYTNGEYRFPQKFLIDETRKVAYCVIPKAGCTNWKRALILTTGKISENDLKTILEPRSVNLERNPSSFLHGSRALFWKFGIYNSDEYSEASLKRMMPDLFKFVFVRCPYKRLLSAFRDKFEKVDNINKIYYQSTYGAYIVKRYRTNSTHNSLPTGSDVTFREFLQFIADSFAEHRPLDRHWLPFHEICDPCVHNFDFIGKIETLDEDSGYVLNRLGGHFHFPSSESGPSSERYGKNNSASLLEYYASIPQALLQRIIDIYEKDFELFGYKTQLDQC